MSKNILVTGSGGFIGFHYSKLLLDKKFSVYGVDSLNNYYDRKIKLDRLKILKKYTKFNFFKKDILNFNDLEAIVKKYKIRYIVHLAAQAGVRYSISNPEIYISNNVKGFLNVLEVSRLHKIKHLVYASSSSVYGLNKDIPFNVSKKASHPISTYAATKRSNELMAHVYSNLYKLPTTGLRFFTVYGPWGRPDMSLFKFTKLNFSNKKIELFNYGNHLRDFTYIDDVTQLIFRAMNKIPKFNKKNLLTECQSIAPWKIYNISSASPTKLIHFINEIQKQLGKKFKFKKLPLQMGDVQKTSGSMKLTIRDLKYKPIYNLKYGIKKFISWYKEYYKT